MNDKVIFKIIDREAKQLVQTALLLAENKKDAASLLNEMLDEALRQLWSSK